MGLAASNQCFCCLPFLPRQLVGYSNHFYFLYLSDLYLPLKVFGHFTPFLSKRDNNDFFHNYDKALHFKFKLNKLNSKQSSVADIDMERF